ncbi:MAG: long-chain fatty acid--CoA ligase [Actinobacteria bacterium]|nr:MAG: long-chain fatty acid--CoA ligase [Actinomycetota bacterium]
MLEGLVQQDFPLTIGYVVDRLRTVNGGGEIVSSTGEGTERARYDEVAARVDRLCAALRDLGVREGDRVATLAWNHQRHFECYLAIPAMGAVLHTLNLRLFPDQLAYIANHAEDTIVFLDDSLVELWEKVVPQLETVRHNVLMGDGDGGSLPNLIRYEDLLAGQDDGFDYPQIDDRQAAALCYTSGTTGNPKGVLYSHRSSVLHSLGACLADTLAVSRADRVLPIVPMFHANAWGLPYAAALAGADLVMPNRWLQAEPLCRLIEGERVTVSGAVPTIWMDILRYADKHHPDLSSLRLVACGGSAVPRALMEALEERHDVPVCQAWGMTETSPLGSVARPPRDAEGERHWQYRSTAGRPVALVEVRIVGDEGDALPWDGKAEGELECRGPWVASAYYRDAAPEKFHDGWLRTGDIASIDPDGYIIIRDRTKDVIKSGGEWISSVDLENELMAHPDVLEAAVIAKPDERWAERPLACVVVREGAELDADQVAAHLEPRVARWWVPDEYAFIDEVPKTSTGKFDKKVLRQRLADGELADRQTVTRKAEPARSS